MRASLLISSLLPVGVLMTFILMRRFGVDANIVALSGIAIAIGVMVDVGIIFSENIVRHTEADNRQSASGKDLIAIIKDAVIEVAPAVITALTTTIVSFLPVFALQAAEGKLFRPLAFTKTFAMLSALIIGLFIIPSLAYMLFSWKVSRKKWLPFLNFILVPAGFVFFFLGRPFLALSIMAFGLFHLTEKHRPAKIRQFEGRISTGLIIFMVVSLLARAWMPLGVQVSLFGNLLFVAVLIGTILGVLMAVVHTYERLLSWALLHKWRFLSLPIIVILFSLLTWQGANHLFGFLPDPVLNSQPWKGFSGLFPGLGREFMPSLDEGSFLLMPTTMPHSGIEENLEVIRLLDKRINAIPEVDNVTGKWGRVMSALDPAPVSMFENVINYQSEYLLDEKGHRMRFRTNRQGAFVLKGGSAYHPLINGFRTISRDSLIEDRRGKYFRQWRDHIRSPDDIWNEIVNATHIPGLTSAPKLQPIQTRLVMLQTGMRAPLGILSLIHI